MTGAPQSPVVSLDALDGFEMTPEGGSARFGATVASIGAPLRLTGLGAMLITLAPGKRAFPFHNHLANDEMFIILDGEGTYRLGEAEYPVKAGDVCAAPRGGKDTAHQIVNTSDAPLRYVGVSTAHDPDIVEYPDSGKYAAMAIWPGASFFEAHLKVVGRADESLDYWDGEEL